MTEPKEPDNRQINMGDSGDYHEDNRNIDLSDGDVIESIGRDFLKNVFNVFNVFQDPNEKQASLQRNKTQQALLDWVQHEVAARLKQSLHNRVSILLEKEEDPTQVIPPWAIDVKIGTHQPFRLPSETTITDIYDREDIKGRLLILGAPGSGKTTTLLQLAEVLVTRAQEDINQPIPVLLNLSSWKDDKQKISDWIIDNLKLLYGLRKDLAGKWLEEGVILPLLDGLDELASTRQETSVQRLNEFLSSEGALRPLVVCSRTEEYQLYSTRLALNGSIIIQLLIRQQIQDYVRRTEGEELWNSIKDDQYLMELAKTPLLLNIMVISCEELSFYKWQKLKTSKQRLSYLFDAYIRRMLSRQYKGKQPRPEKTKHWLGWLAVQLIKQNQTEFLIEYIQPYWLDFKNKKRIYGLIVGLIVWLIVGLIVGLFLGLTLGLTLGLILGLIYGLFLGLIYGLFFGLIVGLFFGLTGTKIQPIETLKFSLGHFRKELILGLIYGLILGLIVGLIFLLIYGPTVWQIVGLIYGQIGVLIVVQIRGFSGPEIDIKNSPNQGIKKSIKNTVRLGIIISAILIIVVIPIQLAINYIAKIVLQGVNLEEVNTLIYALLPLGIALSIVKSGTPAIQHFSLRVVLWFSGYAPWNYARFLDYATNRLFLQRVGGGYRFIHRLLQEHFACYVRR